MKKYAIIFGLTLFPFPTFTQTDTYRFLHFDNLQFSPGWSAKMPTISIESQQRTNLFFKQQFSTFILNKNIENNLFVFNNTSPINLFKDTSLNRNHTSTKEIFKKIGIFTLSSALIAPTILDTNTHLVLTIGSIYGYSSLAQKYLCKASDKIPLPVRTKYFLYAYGAGMLLENFVTIDNRNLPLAIREKVQFSPYRNKDLLIGLGFYAPFALGGAWLSNKYNYSYNEIFIMTALSGILIEQQGRVFLSFSPINWLAVSIPYGSFQALPALLTKNQLNNIERKKIKMGKKIIFLLGTQTAAIITGSILGLTIKSVIK